MSAQSATNYDPHFVTEQVDVVVYGGTVAGVVAALAAARAGKRTMLIERGDHLGGMVDSGLGMIDLLRPHAVSIIELEYKNKVIEFYSQTYGETPISFASAVEGSGPSRTSRKCSSTRWWAMN